MRFPYMRWAIDVAGRTRYVLSTSGTPPTDVDLLGPGDLPVTEPLGTLTGEVEARIGELLGIPAARVLVTLGGAGAMRLAAWRWFTPASTVVSTTPSYQPVTALPAAHGARAVVLDTHLAGGWDIEPARVAAVLDRPGHVFVTNPGNPTGARLPPQRIAELGAAAARASGVLIVNEVYMEFAQADDRATAAASIANAVSIGSLTKAYRLGALRIGWLALGDDLAAERATLEDLGHLTWGVLPTVTLALALRALERREALLQPYRTTLERSRPVFDGWLTTTPGIAATIPESGVVAFPRIDGVTDTAALAAYLREHADVDVVPGEFFGFPGHLRIGCGAVAAAELPIALERLAAGVDAFTTGQGMGRAGSR